MDTQIIGSRRLKTALAIATARARRIARANFERRLDAAAYRCHRGGAAWIAEGAGQRFDYSRTEAGEVLCISGSGGIYLLPAGGGCDCMAAAKSTDGRCKHQVALESVKMAHRMERMETRAALSAEGEELARLRSEGEDADRQARAEWGAAECG